MNSTFIVTEIEPIAHPSEKDWLALEFLDSVRLARTSHIVDSVGWSTEYGPKRLRQYHRAGWVMKFPQYLEFSGSPEDIYALTTLGAKHLRNARGIKTSPTQDQKNRKLLDEQGKLPLPAHHLHTLGIAEVTRRFHVGCRAMNGAVNFIDQPAFTTMLPPTTRALPNPWSWGVQAHPNHFWKTGIALDRAFALDLAYRGQRSHLFFEFYRNMPLYRTNLINQRSVILKLLCLAKTRSLQLTEKFVTRRFGFNNFRGLIILKPDEERKAEINVDNLADYIQEHLKHIHGYADNLFLLANWEDLDPANILYTKWRNGRGDVVQLIE